MKSSEQVARAAYEALPTADKMTVMSWRELGNSWQDSMLSSGVCSGPRPSAGYRMTPREAERQRQIDQFNEESLARRERNLLPDECSRRYETAHHEASHAVIVMALNKSLRSVSIDSDDARGGLCLFERGLTPLEIATVCVAPIVWIERVYYREFRHYLPWGATGCESDLRRAQELVGYDMSFQLGRAFAQAKEILRDAFDKTEALANRLDRDGEWRP